MKFEFVKSLDELTTTPAALIDTRKYIGGWLFFDVTRIIFNKVVDDLEQLNYQGSTVQAMKAAYNETVKRINALEAPQRAKNAYLKDIREATKGAIIDEQQG